jgi:hypothetical protein
MCQTGLENSAQKSHFRNAVASEKMGSIRARGLRQAGRTRDLYRTAGRARAITLRVMKAIAHVSLLIALSLPFLIGLQCGETRLCFEFHRLRGAKDSLQSRCKDCHKANRRAWKRTESGREAGRHYANSERATVSESVFIVSSTNGALEV